jgi:cell division protein FtsW (lipid II flippase)
LFKNHLARAGWNIHDIPVLKSRLQARHKIPQVLIITAVLMLLYLLVAGIESTKGASWIRIAGFSFQPADFVKYALVINIAYMLAVKDYVTNFMHWLHSHSNVCNGCCMIIAAQPNFSTHLLCLCPLNDVLQESKNQSTWP